MRRLSGIKQTCNMKDVTKLFFELIQISLGNKNTFERLPSDEEWQTLFDLAEKQALTSVLLIGLDRVLSQPGATKPSILFEWIGAQQMTECQNRLQDERANQLTELFSKHGFRSCVLKGQGTALYYENPEFRQCGDIDIWVSSHTDSTDIIRDKVLQFVKEEGYHIGHVDIKHSDVDFFEDVPVEVHFLPSWMYCPSTNKRLQKFFEENAEKQFANVDEQLDLRILPLTSIWYIRWCISIGISSLNG